jgi:hypothetical protein
MNVSTWFFRFGVLAVLCGMGLGIWMGQQENFTLAPAHAHLNLVGFVLPFIFGFFYRSFPAAAAGLWPKVHFGLSILGVLMMIPSLSFLLLGNTTYLPVLIAGEFATALGMIIFAIKVFGATGKGPAPAAAE